MTELQIKNRIAEALESLFVEGLHQGCKDVYLQIDSSDQIAKDRRHIELSITVSLSGTRGSGHPLTLGD